MNESSTPRGSSVELRVVHALRLHGFADLDAVVEMVTMMGGANATPILPGPVIEHLDALVEHKRARYRDGTLTGWLLTKAGRTFGEDLLARELDAVGGRVRVEAVYRSFLALNGDFLTTCSQWQIRPGRDGEKVLNDHNDARYDNDIISRVGRFDDQVQPLCADLASLLCRFERYGPRFARALTAVRAGETDWMAKPSIDSYHSVWFELHEDLLASLGIERRDEQPMREEQWDASAEY